MLHSMGLFLPELPTITSNVERFSVVRPSNKTFFRFSLFLVTSDHEVKKCQTVSFYLSSLRHKSILPKKWQIAFLGQLR